MPGRQWDTLFMMALDFQVLFGLLLYFGLSPFTMEASKDSGSVVANTGLRFWTIDHLAWMGGATVLVRIGRVLALNAKTPQARRKWRALFFTLTTITILAAFPGRGSHTDGRCLDSGNSELGIRRIGVEF